MQSDPNFPQFGHPLFFEAAVTQSEAHKAAGRRQPGGGSRAEAAARPTVEGRLSSRLYQLLVPRHTGFASCASGVAAARNSLTSAGVLLFIFMIYGFHAGDLNPIGTVPMPGKHKTVVDKRLPASRRNDPLDCNP